MMISSSSIFLLRASGLALAAFLVAQQAGIAQGPATANDPLAATIRPFVERNCVSCHNANLPSGSLDFQALLSAPDTLTVQRSEWDKAVSFVRENVMPPAGSPRPPQNEVDAFMASLTQELARAAPAPAAAPVAERPATKDWTTYNYDPERTGWNRAETTLNRGNVSKVQLLWRAQLDAAPTPANHYSSLTDALVVNGVQTRQGPKNLVFTASAENNVFAIEAETGKVFWTRKFPNTDKPPVAPSGNCPENLNATPVIDKEHNIIYVLPNDGKLRGLSLDEGEDLFPASPMVPPFTRNFSLNQVDDMIYTGTTRGCANAVSSIVGIHVSGSDHNISAFYPSTGKGSGPWGRAGIVKGPNGMLAMTADGPYDPAGGRFGDSVLNLNHLVRLTDSYTPDNERYLSSKDLDLGSASPIVFPFDRWILAAASAKEGVIYLLDAKDLGGDDHRTPLYRSQIYGNEAVLFGYNGMWGAMTTWVDPKGDRWLYVPMLGPVPGAALPTFPSQHGKVVNGSVEAFKVEMQDGKPVVTPQWLSADLDLPGVPVVANGVIYVLATGDRAGIGGRGGAAGGNAAAGAPGRGAPAGAGGGRGGRGGGGGRGPQVNTAESGYKTDQMWVSDQFRPPAEGGQQGGARYSGGRDTTHAVLYALDAATGEELYSSADAIDSWNHYGNLTLSNGQLYVTTYDDRVYAFGLPKK